MSHDDAAGARPPSAGRADPARDRGRDDPGVDPGPSNDGADPSDPVPSPVAAGRWAVAAGIALLAVGLGVVTQNRAVLVAAVVPLAFVAYGRLSTAPTPDLDARRSFEPARPAVGERVTVTVTVRNRGQALRDCRLADDVPGALGVVEGTAATAATLRPGEETSFDYVVRARRGDHTFGPLRAAATAAAGASAATVELPVESRLRCRATGAGDAASAPAASSGDAASDSRGGGVEFHAVREYRRADPLSRVDWRRFARTGELATVEFREERGATVAIVVDATAPTFRRASADAPAAVEYALFAAEGAFEALLERDASVALALHPDAPAALGPGRGVDHRTLGRRAFDAYGPGASRDPAEVPVALGAAGDPTARDGPPRANGADGGDEGAASGSDTRADTADLSPGVVPDGGDPFGDAFEPVDGEDGTDGRNRDGGDGEGGGDRGSSGRGGGDGDRGGDDAYDPATAFGGSPDPGEERDSLTALRASLPTGARVLVCSPMLHDGAADLVRTLRADDHDVRVLSPVPGGTAPAPRLMGFERADRVADIRAEGVGVVDWAEEPLREALARALREW